MKFNKGFSPIAVVVIVLILLAAGGGVWWWKTQYAGPDYGPVSPAPAPAPTPPPSTPADPTANWKTYRNERYGFEIKYPPGYELYRAVPEIGFESGGPIDRWWWRPVTDPQVQDSLYVVKLGHNAAAPELERSALVRIWSPYFELYPEKVFSEGIKPGTDLDSEERQLAERVISTIRITNKP